MTHQDILSIGITAVVGLLLGIYVYIIGFAPTYRLPEVGTSAGYAGLVIVADAYGACATTGECFSFQLRGDGTYRAFFSGKVADAYEGKLSGALYRRLSLLTSATLTPYTESLPAPECHYGADGTNYRMLVTVEGANHPMDTCTTTIDYESAVWLLLSEVSQEVVTQLVTK